MSKISVKNSHLYQEIHEQPDVLARLLSHEKTKIQQLAAEIKKRRLRYVVIAARGTSDNAARYAQYLLGSINRLPVALATPSLFSIYKKPPDIKDALVLGISQSGQSPDILAVLSEARRQKALTAVITNYPDSILGQTADHVLSLQTGIEQSVAATKTYTSELAAVALLSAFLADNGEMQAAFDKLPGFIAKTLTMGAQIEIIAERYRYMRACVTIGRGYNYATAFELALKIKELTYTSVESYSSADFLHGPVAMIEPGFPVIVIAPSGVMLPEMQDFIPVLKDRGAEVIVISDDSDILKLARIPLLLPTSVPEWLSPIISIVPGQLFAMHLAAIKGYDPDHPRFLEKVTQTY